MIVRIAAIYASTNALTLADTCMLLLDIVMKRNTGLSFFRLERQDTKRSGDQSKREISMIEPTFEKYKTELLVGAEL